MLDCLLFACCSGRFKAISASFLTWLITENCVRKLSGVWKKRTTGTCSLKDKRANWHPSVCPLYASYCHHSLIGRIQDVKKACQIGGKWMLTLHCRVELCGCKPFTIKRMLFVAVRHDRRREISPFWLAVLLEDVQIELYNGNFLRQRVALQWLNQTCQVIHLRTLPVMSVVETPPNAF